MNKKFFYFMATTMFFVACSKDDEKSIAAIGVSIEPSTLTLIAGDTETLTAIVQPKDATNQAITWMSSNKEAATVDADGNVTAESQGTAIITATTQDGGKSANCTVTVHPKITKLFKKQGITIGVCDLVPLTMFINQEVKENTKLEWHSNNEAVAVVDDRGYVRSLSAGVVIITCAIYDGKIQDNFTITIFDEGFPLILYKEITGILSSEDGETIDTNSTMEMWCMCIDGKDFSYCSLGLSMKITYESKEINFSCYELKIIPEKDCYSLYGEATVDGYPCIISGTLNPENASVTLKISLTKESPVNLFFQGSVKEKYIEMTMTTESAVTVNFQIGGTGKMTINWGDGSEIETHHLLPSSYEDFWGNTDNRYSRRYAKASTCTITITGDNVTHFYYYSNPITRLDVNNNSALFVLECSNSQITRLDVSNNRWLSLLNCSGNQITTLNVKKCIGLNALDCGSNQITELDISNNHSLTILGCENNQITNLDLSKSPII